MPLDGEKLNDLLSGFVDGELTEAERTLVEEAARGDARIAGRLEQLRQQSSWVRQYGSALANAGAASSGSAPSGPELAQRVISAAKQRGRQAGLPATHFIQPYATVEPHAADEPVESSRAAGSLDLSRPRPAIRADKAAQSSRGRTVGWMAIGGLAAAAALLIAVTWPRWQHDHVAQQSQPTALDRAAASPNNQLADNSVTVESSVDEIIGESDAAGSGLVGKSTGMAYALVVDVEVTASAERNHALEKILATAGIPLAPPVAANPEIFKALDDSRMIVRNPAVTARQVSIQVVRGDMHELDIALRNIWRDSNHFPNVAINLSIDSRATLMREILRSVGNRFAPTDRFAIPLAIDPTAIGPASAVQAAPASGRVSPFPGADGGVKYISKSQRESGWEGMGELSGTQLDSMTTILLVMHRVE